MGTKETDKNNLSLLLVFVTQFQCAQQKSSDKRTEESRISTMTTYPQWINEEAVNQTDIGVVRYSVVYSDASVLLLSIRDVLPVEYNHAETDSIKSHLAGTVVSESLRLCNKIIGKNS